MVQNEYQNIVLFILSALLLTTAVFVFSKKYLKIINLIQSLLKDCYVIGEGILFFLLGLIICLTLF